ERAFTRWGWRVTDGERYEAGFLNSRSRRICLVEVINKNAVADAGCFARLGHLERDEFAVIAYDGIRGFEAGKITEVREPLTGAAAVEFKLPEVHIAGASEVLLVALDERKLAVREDALRFVVLAGRVGVVCNLF